MMTVRQIERWWDSKEYGRLSSELLASRLEDSPQLRQACRDPIAAAALAMIRLDELDQSHAGLYERLLRKVIAAQESDGGWKDPLVTALVLRALLNGRGAGAAIESALGYLAQLQQEQGSWPAEPLRRMPADAFVTAFIVYSLSDSFDFQRLARVDAAVAYLDAHATHDPFARQLHNASSKRHSTFAMN